MSLMLEFQLLMEKSYGDIDTADLDNYLLGRAPYPGGIGPITVSALYSNLAKLIS